MTIHKWTSYAIWLLPTLSILDDTHDTTLCIGWWKWHVEFIFEKNLNEAHYVK
jgi:hypothetical protein